MNPQVTVIDDKELKNLYQTHQTVGIKKTNDKWERKFCHVNYSFWGFIVYPIFKNTRLLAIIKAIIAKILVRTHILYKEKPLSTTAAFNNIAVLHSSNSNVTASTAIQNEVLSRVKRVVKDIEGEVVSASADAVDTVEKLDKLAQNVLNDFTVDKKNKVNKLAIKILERIVCDEISDDEREILLKKVQSKQFSTKVNDKLEILLDDVDSKSTHETSVFSSLKPVDDDHETTDNVVKDELKGDKNIVTQVNDLLVSGQSKVAKRTNIVENGSEKSELETLAHIDKVIQDVQSIYTRFVPKQNVAPTAPQGVQATDAQFIKKLDNLKLSIENYIKSKSLSVKKLNTLNAIDTAIVKIAKSALAAPARKEVFLMARNGQLTKTTRENLGPVLFKQYLAKDQWSGTQYPVELNTPAFNSLRSNEEICEDVLKIILNRLKRETNKDTIKLLTNIQKRYAQNLASLKADPNHKSSSTEKNKAQRVLSWHAFEEKIKDRKGGDLLKEAMAARDYKRYQKSLISKKLAHQVDLSVMIGEGESWYNFFKDMELNVDPVSGKCGEFDTINGACNSLGLVIKQSGYLSDQDLEALRQEIMKNIFEKYYQNPEYSLLAKQSSKKQLNAFYKKFAPKGFSGWMAKGKEDRKQEVEKAGTTLASSSKVRIPEWHHCTPSATAFISICKTSVKPSHAPYGSGAFASNTIEMPSYGNWGFAFDAASVVANVPVNAFKKSHGAHWVGYSEALQVPIMDANSNITGLDVAYVIVNDKDYSSHEEENQIFNQAAFSVHQSGGVDIPEHEKQTVKGVRKMLAKEGIQGVTVVTLDEALLEKELLFGDVCQTPIWESGYGENLGTDMEDNSNHPTLYDINRQKYPGNLRSW